MSVISGGTALNGLSAGGNARSSAGSAGISIIFLRLARFRRRDTTVQIDADRSLVRDHDAANPYCLGRVVRRPQLEHHLVLGAEVDRLQMTPAAQIPDVHRDGRT